ncbi:MAG: hypothetical protein QXP80_06370 [Zestosphaera sp.]
MNVVSHADSKRGKVRAIIREELRVAILMCHKISICQGRSCSTRRRYEGQGLNTLCVNPSNYDDEKAVESMRKIIERVNELGIK